jgi:hypothetical protein
MCRCTTRSKHGHGVACDDSSSGLARPSTGDTLRDIISKATAAGPGHIRVDSYLERLLSPVGKPYCEVWSVIVLSTVYSKSHFR